MCGISGIVYLDPDRQVYKEELVRMTAPMIHRGPDDEGYYLNQNVNLQTYNRKSFHGVDQSYF